MATLNLQLRKRDGSGVEADPARAPARRGLDGRRSVLGRRRDTTRLDKGRSSGSHWTAIQSTGLSQSDNSAHFAHGSIPVQERGSVISRKVRSVTFISAAVLGLAAVAPGVAIAAPPSSPATAAAVS